MPGMPLIKHFFLSPKQSQTFEHWYIVLTCTDNIWWCCILPPVMIPNYARKPLLQLWQGTIYIYSNLLLFIPIDKTLYLPTEYRHICTTLKELEVRGQPQVSVFTFHPVPNGLVIVHCVARQDCFQGFSCPSLSFHQKILGLKHKRSKV